MSNRKTLIYAVCGATIGIAIGLAGKALILEPYFAAKHAAANAAHQDQLNAENRQRDELTAAELEKLDPRSRKAACEGYIGGLKEQNIPISALISSACAGT
ncbi:hypothetical protein HBO10_29585 [Pseudomonas sp. WS 5503]|uniref:hypothetical protein n=1 Tax=Pseudomonas TaxID=286 RepID=UPI001473F43D|nr:MULTISPECIES: hypothetical protein [Pseudomonas]MBF6043416.1 hypothetical protein [Pseudomonas mucoides]NMX83660.1 hypothetical protein [Pseudomonas sp. WS 5503]NNB23632.1 hypothetical protein [Pseudomonas fragi]